MSDFMKGIHFGLTCKIFRAKMPSLNENDGNYTWIMHECMFLASELC